MSTPLGNCSEEEYTLPSAEALLGGTLALMTGLNQAACAQHRELLALKIAANLATLTQSPHLSAGFRHLLESLRQRWLVPPGTPELPGPATVTSGVWHPAPAVLQ